MPAKKGEAQPASSKKAAAPAKGAAKAPAKDAKAPAAKKAAAKATTKKAAAGVKGPAKTTKKAKSPAKATDAVKKVVAKKAAVAAKKAAPKKVVSTTDAAAAKKAAKGPSKTPATKKTIKKDTRTVTERIGKKGALWLSERLKKREAKNKIDVARRRVAKSLWEAKQKAKNEPKKPKQPKAEKKALTPEERKKLGPWKIINKRKVIPKLLRPSTKITAEGKVWTPTSHRKPKGYNALKIRKGKLNAIHRAVKAKNMLDGGARMKSLRKIWTTVQFRRPKTKRLPKNPQYPRRSIPRKQRLDQFSILKHPHTTETAMKKLDDENTLVFVVHVKANKHKIKSAVRKMYDVKPIAIRTVITPLAEKKAYVRLHPDNDALDVANKIGMI